MISCLTSSNNCLICTPFTLLVTIIYTKCFFLFSICITTKLSRIDNGNRTEWSSIRSLIIRVINKIWRPRSESPICLITCVITDRIGRHEVLLLVNHNRYNFRENICILLWWKSIWIPNVPKKLGKISLAETLSSVTNSSILENSQFGRVSVVVAMVIVITSVIGEFIWLM